MSGAIATAGSASLAVMAVLALTNAAPGEATEGFLEGLMLLGGVEREVLVTGGAFLGTATSNGDGFSAGDATLPLAVVVLVSPPFPSKLDVADLLLLIPGRARLLI